MAGTGFDPSAGRVRPVSCGHKRKGSHMHQQPRGDLAPDTRFRPHPSAGCRPTACRETSPGTGITWRRSGATHQDVTRPPARRGHAAGPHTRQRGGAAVKRAVAPRAQSPGARQRPPMFFPGGAEAVEARGAGRKPPRRTPDLRPGPTFPARAEAFPDETSAGHLGLPGNALPGLIREPGEIPKRSGYSLPGTPTAQPRGWLQSQSH